jgi:hypothetical protein
MTWPASGCSRVSPTQRPRPTTAQAGLANSSSLRDKGFSLASRDNDARNDWSYYRKTANEGLSASKLIMTLPNTGCAHVRRGRGLAG